MALSNHAGGSGAGGAGVPGGAPGPVTYSGTSVSEQPGTGTLDAGATGGSSYASRGWNDYPHYTQVRGGSGGAPGAAGSTGGHHGGNGAEQQRGIGGPAGPAIDGV